MFKKFSLFLALLICGVSSSIAQTFPTSWGFYVPITINSGVVNQTVQMDIDFGALLTIMGIVGTLDENSIRVVRPNGTLAINQEFTDVIFAGATDAVNNNKGEVKWILEDAGTTTYKIYFDTIENGAKPTNPQTPINGNFEKGITGQAQPLGWNAPTKQNTTYDAQVRPSENPTVIGTRTVTTNGTPNTGSYSYLIGDRTTDGTTGSAITASITKTINVSATNPGNLTFSYRLEGWDSSANLANQWDYFQTQIITKSPAKTTTIVGPSANNYLIYPFSPNYGTGAASNKAFGYGSYNSWDFGTGTIHRNGMTIAKGAEPWFNVTYSLSAFAGKTITLNFNIYQNTLYKTWVHIDDVEWSIVSGYLGTPVNLNPINHYEIEFSPDNTSSLTCRPQTIKVRSCSTTAAPCTNVADQSTSTSTLGLTTSLGKFISSGTATTNIDVNGNTTDSLSVTTAGTTTITAGGSIPLKCYSGSTLLGSCISTFSNSGIFFDWQTNQQVGIDGVVTAGNTSNVVKLSALKADKTNACVGFQPTSGTVNLNMSYTDPVSGTQTMNVTPTDSAGAGTSGTVAIGTIANGVNFVWNANGNTYLTTKYVDAGKVALNASISAGSTYPSMSTSTNLISKPYVISAYKNITDVTCANGTIFSGTSSNKFCPAGEVFSTKVRAFAADGVTTLPNFGKESAASTLTMQGSLILGANGGNIKNESSGVSAVLTTGVNFTPSGQVCSGGDCYYPMNFSWDNVGEIYLTPIIAGDNYFGSGAITVKRILPVGRFYPFVFGYTSSNIINRPTCSPTPSFTYMGENFNAIVTISALNKAGVVTNNYDGSKFPATNTSLWNLKAISGTTMLNSRIVLVSGAGTWSNGVLSASLTANLSRTTNPDGSYLTTLGITPIDTDGVSFASSNYDLDTDKNGFSDAKNIGSTNFYFGRMKIVGNVGSEIIKMPLSVTVQKYVNNGFITNIDDSCTKINNANITKANFSGTLTSTNIVVSSPVSSATMVNGQQTIVLAPPGGSNNGTVDIGYDVNGTTQSYLAGNWGFSTYDQNPKGKVVFSRQQAKKKLIFTNQNF